MDGMGDWTVSLDEASGSDCFPSSVRLFVEVPGPDSALAILALTSFPSDSELLSRDVSLSSSGDEERFWSSVSWSESELASL